MKHFIEWIIMNWETIAANLIGVIGTMLVIIKRTSNKNKLKEIKTMLELEMNELTKEELKLIEEHRKNQKIDKSIKIERLEKPLVPKLDLEDNKLTLKEILNQEPYAASPRGLIEAEKDRQDYEELKDEYYNKQLTLDNYNKLNKELLENIERLENELVSLFKKIKEYL